MTSLSGNLKHLVEFQSPSAFITLTTLPLKQYPLHQHRIFVGNLHSIDSKTFSWTHQPITNPLIIYKRFNDVNSVDLRCNFDTRFLVSPLSAFILPPFVHLRNTSWMEYCNRENINIDLYRLYQNDVMNSTMSIFTS